jgi:hypothetical protein
VSGEPEREHIEARDIRPGLHPRCRATAGTAGPGPLPAPGVTSASGITKKSHDDRAIYRITDAISGICQRHADAAPAAPELRKGQTKLSTAAANCRKVQQSADDLEARLAKHAAGQGARLLAVVKEAGIEWELARTWPGGRARERQLKRQGGAARMCPLCGVRPRETERELEA